MEVINYSWKLVKPSMPTPPSIRLFNISFTDELAPAINVPLILYYSASPPPSNPTVTNDRSGSIICDHLEDSLSKTLTEFYPLAGRYIRELSVVDCNDQGVPYVLGKANVQLSEVPRQPDRLNNLLPCEIGEADEADDPVLSIKVTTFECGGLAIGMCFSHRISDMGTTCTFINNWVSKTNGGSTLDDDEHKLNYSPIFNSAVFFPPRGLPELALGASRSSVGAKNTARRFHFTRDAISAMSKEKVRFDANEPCTHKRPSKVQLVVALLWKAFLRIDRATNSGRSKASFLIQPVGFRDKVVPQLPTNSCGNFWGLATSELGHGECNNDMDFQDLFKLLCESVKKTIKDCAKILAHGEEGYGILINPYLESNQKIADNDVNFYLFTCWSKFSFYKANFGFGKPVWASTGKLPVQNLVILMDDQEGNGVEAWVHLDERKMKELEQDYDIKTYAF